MLFREKLKIYQILGLKTPLMNQLNQKEHGKKIHLQQDLPIQI